MRSGASQKEVRILFGLVVDARGRGWSLQHFLSFVGILGVRSLSQVSIGHCHAMALGGIGVAQRIELSAVRGGYTRWADTIVFPMSLFFKPTRPPLHIAHHPHIPPAQPSPCPHTDSQSQATSDQERSWPQLRQVSIIPGQPRGADALAPPGRHTSLGGRKPVGDSNGSLKLKSDSGLPSPQR